MVATSEPISQRQRYTTDDAKSLQRVFARVAADSCPGIFNFHMHTACSDGKLPPDQLMQQVIDIGLRAFAITDHHTVKGFYQARAWLEDWRWSNPTTFGHRRDAYGLTGPSPRLFTGVEITADLGGIEVHILGYGFSPHHEAIQPYLKHRAPRGNMKLAMAVIRAIQTAGGLAVLAHPARYKRPPETLIPYVAELGIDGVEAYYAYDNPLRWHPCPQHTPTIETLAAQHDLLTTCGTDTHGTNLLRRL
jgi:predicted metal-dependent phosphoesterase TrpH